MPLAVNGDGLLAMTVTDLQIMLEAAYVSGFNDGSVRIAMNDEHLAEVVRNIMADA